MGRRDVEDVIDSVHESTYNEERYPEESQGVREDGLKKSLNPRQLKTAYNGLPEGLLINFDKDTQRAFLQTAAKHIDHGNGFNDYFSESVEKYGSKLDERDKVFYFATIAWGVVRDQLEEDETDEQDVRRIF